jgi:hypothetical protein
MRSDTKNTCLFDNSISKYVCYVRLDKQGGDVGNGFFRRIGRCEAETLDGFTHCGCGYGTDCIDVFAETSHTGIDVYTNAMTQYEAGLRRPRGGAKRVSDPLGGLARPP